MFFLSFIASVTSMASFLSVSVALAIRMGVLGIVTVSTAFVAVAVIYLAFKGY